MQRKLVWFITGYFVHNIDLIAQSRKNSRPQSSNDETVLAEETDYVWDPDWSHPSFINMTTDISSTAITNFSVDKKYVRNLHIRLMLHL